MIASLQIQKKVQKDFLTLKVITEKEKFPSLVEKNDSQITLISEEKTYYLYFNKKEGYNFHKVYNFFVAFANKNERDINIEVNSFITNNLKEETILQAIIEGILYGSHHSITYKTDKKTNSKMVNYHLITSNKEANNI